MPYIILRQILNFVRPKTVKRKTSRLIWNVMTDGFL